MCRSLFIFFPHFFFKIRSWQVGDNFVFVLVSVLSCAQTLTDNQIFPIQAQQTTFDRGRSAWESENTRPDQILRGSENTRPDQVKSRRTTAKVRGRRLDVPKVI